jgi:uridine kinase
VLRDLGQGRPAKVPVYDFSTHCRASRPKVLRPKPIVLVEGLWLLRRRSIRRLFSLCVFIECPTRTRLRRRLERDVLSRSRTRASILRQFEQTVEPMHGKYVTPQIRDADLVFRGGITSEQARSLAAKVRAAASAGRLAGC